MTEKFESEKTSLAGWKAPETGTSLYPERPSLDSSLQAKAEYLQKFFDGEISVPELSETERAELVDFENTLGEQLESAHNVDVHGFDFYPAYFLSDVGRKKFQEIFHTEPLSVPHVKQTILSQPETVLSQSKTLRQELSGASRVFARDAFLEEYGRANGDISLVHDPERSVIIADPKNLLRKAERITEFRSWVRAERHELAEKKRAGSLTSAEQAREAVLTLYSRRSHEVIQNTFEAAAAVASKAELLGPEKMAPAEVAVMSLFAGTKNWKKRTPNVARHLGRYDKFVFGASTQFTEYEKDGEPFRERTQIPAELLASAEEAVDFWTNEYVASLQKDPLAERNIDREKVQTLKIDAEAFAAWVNQVYEDHGMKSAYEYVPGSAHAMPPDGKWRTYIHPSAGNISVSAEHVMFIPEKKPPRDVTKAIPLVAHEMTHVFQAENRSSMPLRLFQHLNSDRRSIAAEAGSMAVEGNLSRELFGVPTAPVPYYVRGMARKLSGGSFKDVFKQMDEDTLQLLDARASVEGLTGEKYQKELLKQRQTRFDSALRLFSGPVSLAEKNPYITSSRATVYLEQVVFIKTLQDAGAEWLADFGIHPDTVILLSQTGLVKPGTLKHLNLDAVRNIWEQVKGEYQKTE